MASWQPVMTPLKIIVLFLAVGVCFIPTGTSIVKSTNSVSLVNQHEKKAISTYLPLKLNHISLNWLHYNHRIIVIISQVFEQRQVYDGSNPDYVQCQIGSANEGKKCSVRLFINEKAIK